MKIIQSTEEFNRLNLKQSIAAIGNFDGIHKGHQSILKSFMNDSKQHQLPSVLFTFKIHPKNIINPSKKIFPIISIQQKFEIFENLGVQICFCADFEKDFKDMKADCFIEHFLIKTLKAKSIHIGQNFHFGKNATGNTAQLNNYSQTHRLSIHIHPLIKDRDTIISSTVIRKKIMEQKFDQANHYLGKTLFITKKIIPGFNIAQKIGYPTANIDIHPELKDMKNGIYFTRVWMNDNLYYGLMYIGHSPTLLDTLNRRAEIHILDIPQKKFYDQNLTFQILEHIREDIKFSSKKELMLQIQRDINHALELKNHYE